MFRTIALLKSSRTLKRMRALNSIRTIVRRNRAEFKLISSVGHHFSSNEISLIIRTLNLLRNKRTKDILVVILFLPSR